MTPSVNSLSAWAREVEAPAGLRVWCFSLAGVPTADDWSLLDSTESARAWRFVFDRDRHRYVQAHAATRRLLGAVLGQPAAALAFLADALGKPALAGAAAALHFNLSHGGELGALVVSAERTVGIDIEPWRPMADALAVGATVFAESEMVGWAQAAPHEVDARFLRLWTRKEALLKAIGLGLSLDPKGVAVGLQPARCEIAVTTGTQQWKVNVESLEHHAEAALAIAWL